MKSNNLISAAKLFAFRAHDGQTRKFTGEPYFNHVDSVARMVSRRTQDAELIAAAYLHDTMEDCNVCHAELRSTFSPRVANLVQSLTNDEQAIERMGKVAYMSEKLQKLPADALLIKLCDILHNRSQTQSQQQANNYLRILERLGANKPACWQDMHEALLHSITTGGLIQQCPRCGATWGTPDTSLSTPAWHCGYCNLVFETLPLGTPPPIAEQITRVVYYVGGYMGPSYGFDMSARSCRLELRDVELAIIPPSAPDPRGLVDWRVENGADVFICTPQPDEFRRFVQQLYTQTNPAVWDAEYSEEHVRDGTQWALELYIKGKRNPLRYDGSNAFPPYYHKMLALIRPYFQRLHLPFEADDEP